MVVPDRYTLSTANGKKYLGQQILELFEYTECHG